MSLAEGMGPAMKNGFRLIAMLALALATDAAHAQATYPEKPVRIIVGFPAGVAPDIAARVLAEKLAEAWGKPVVVENVTGAGGNIGADRVAKAAPDGYTLGMVGNGSLIYSPGMYDKLAFDPVRDFAPVSQIFVAANALVVPIDSPIKSLSELVATARAQPGKLTYGHAGAGTSQHLGAELFKVMAQVDIQPIAYRGTTALLPDLLAGRITMSFANVANALALVREGKLRAFAVSSARRSASAPDLPTMAESGYPGFEAVPWFGLMGPAGLPGPLVDRLHRDTVRVMSTPEVRKRFNSFGMDLVLGTPAEFAATIERELPVWTKLIRQAGIKASE
jgi:tripartite-type tricarboxylate transporter receptor subunit TctC